MPEEKPLIIDPILAQLSRLDEKLDAYRSETQREIQVLREEIQSFRYDTHGRLSSLEGGFTQMDKRVENLEKVVGQIQWSLVSGFLVTILAVILTKLL